MADLTDVIQPERAQLSHELQYAAYLLICYLLESPDRAAPQRQWSHAAADPPDPSEQEAQPPG